MKKIGQDIVGIIGAFVTWWALAVIIGILMYAIFPPPTSPSGASFGAGVSLTPQNVPGNIVGFIAALFAFRLVTNNRGRRDS